MAANELTPEETKKQKTREYRSAWVKNHMLDPEYRAKRNEYNRAWIEARMREPEFHANRNEKHRIWRANSPEYLTKEAEYDRERRQANPELALERARRWYLRNAEQQRERTRLWKKANPLDAIGLAQRQAKERAFHAMNRIRSLVKKAKSRAKRRGLEFDNLPQLVSSTPTECRCCGAELDYGMPEWEGSPKGRPRKPRSPSLDRVDNTKGYISSNVRVICWRCNFLKRNATLDELRMIVAYMEG